MTDLSLVDWLSPSYVEPMPDAAHTTAGAGM
jgi:hypothetical protein